MLKDNIEKIKTIVLWTLFLSSIALVAVRYNLIEFFDISQANIKLINPDRIFEEIVLPQDMVVKFDKYNITRIEEKKSDCYRQVRYLLKNVLSQSSTVKEIDRETFDSYFEEYPFVLISFDNMPSSYIEFSADLKKTSISDIGFVQQILIPVDKNVILIKTDEDFFALKSKVNNNLQFMENFTQRSYEKYYPILENVNVNQNILFPLKSSLKLDRYTTVSIFENYNISDIAENIFKEKFDFTASFIQKNGVYFYSHNNGQEILKLDKDGRVEYKNSKIDYAQTDFDKSTKIMLMFLMDLDIDFEKVMISSVEKLDTPKGVIYDFYIQRRIKDRPVYVGDGYGHIQVHGNTVSSCKIYLRDIKKAYGEKEQIVEASKALNTNIKHIMKKLKLKTVEDTLSVVSDVKLVYAYDTEENLIPVWKFDIKGLIFIMDASTGEIIENGMVES